MISLLKGNYRGTDIDVVLHPCTDGQLSLVVKLLNGMMKNRFSQYVTDKKVREIFNLPENDPDLSHIRTEILNGTEADGNCIGFVFTYGTRNLPERISNFSYIHSLCTQVDKLVDYILEIDKKLESREHMQSNEVAVRDGDYVTVDYPNVKVTIRGSTPKNEYPVQLSDDPDITKEELDAKFKDLNKFTFNGHDLTRGECITMHLKDFLEKHCKYPEDALKDYVPEPVPTPLESPDNEAKPEEPSGVEV